MKKENPIIVALDTSSSIKALYWVKRLKVTGCAFKIGFELFSAYGPRIVDKIVNHHVRVFLDLKYHDIPNTVKQASQVATKMGVWMFNVHASGGEAMMKAAREAVNETALKTKSEKPLLIAVTVLTSMASVKELGCPRSVPEQVTLLSQLAHQSGCDGVVSSAQEAALIKKNTSSSFKIVTPGIRLPGDSAGDQSRIMTPLDAVAAGSNYLVMGRSILDSKTPLKTLDSVLQGLRK